MTKNSFIKLLPLALAVALLTAGSLFSQVTTSDMAGRVVDQQGKGLAGVVIEAQHTPTGTQYSAVSDEDGRFNLPLMKPGGPYTVKANLPGYKEQVTQGIQLALGTTATVNFSMTTAISEQVTVTSDTTFSEVRTGAGTNVSGQLISSLPSIARNITDFSRLTPQYGGSGTFAGQDNRMNNITVDGSYFNNSFGLGGQPGARPGVAPISLEAIEQVQVNVAPYDVRQGNFTGAGINTVTRSGTNNFTASGYY